MAALRGAAKRGVEQLEKSRMQNARDGWLQAPKNSVVRATNGWPHRLPNSPNELRLRTASRSVIQSTVAILDHEANPLPDEPQLHALCANSVCVSAASTEYFSSARIVWTALWTTHAGSGADCFVPAMPACRSV
jgi:hypothetical protein